MRFFDFFRSGEVGFALLYIYSLSKTLVLRENACYNNDTVLCGEPAVPFTHNPL